MKSTLVHAKDEWNYYEFIKAFIKLKLFCYKETWLKKSSEEKLVETVGSFGNKFATHNENI